MWIGEGDNDTEVLTVEAIANDFKFHCVAAYGLQETDKSEMKTNFLARLTNELENSAESNSGFKLQMDGIFRAGSEIIPGDPHLMNNNGKFFKEFLSNNSHLTVVNSLDICKGNAEMLFPLKNLPTNIASFGNF